MRRPAAIRPEEFFRGIVSSCLFACRGIVFALRTQRNLRIHLVCAAVVLGGGFYFQFSPLEWVLLVLTVSLVIAGELINTSLEYLLNLLEARNHPVARAVKDIAAGAVLVAVLGSIVVAIILFGPRLARILPSMGLASFPPTGSSL